MGRAIHLDETSLLSAVMRQLSKGLLERVLEAEMTEHLGHESGGVVINPEGDTRNG